MTRSLLSFCASMLLFAGCTQSGIYYEADTRGGFHKIPEYCRAIKQMAPHTLLMGGLFNMISELSGVEKSGTQVRLISHLENTSAPSINCERRRFLTTDAPFSAGLSAAYTMQI